MIPIESMGLLVIGGILIWMICTKITDSRDLPFPMEHIYLKMLDPEVGTKNLPPWSILNDFEWRYSRTDDAYVTFYRGTKLKLIKIAARGTYVVAVERITAFDMGTNVIS